jgi:hypothetical protein
LAAALALAAGWGDVLPCRWTGDDAKAPLLAHGFHDASRDPETITRWPVALIGAVIPVGLIVLDLDPRNGGSINALQSLLGPLPPTLTVLSGRGDGGRHLYFRRPNVPLKPKPVPWLDIKANGYCIMPPSLHPESGEPYRWETRLPAAELPPAAVSRLRQPPSRPLPAPSSAEGMNTRADALIRKVATAPEGNRNGLLFWAVCRAITERHGTDVLDALEAAGQTAGLNPPEVARTMQSAARRLGVTA